MSDFHILFEDDDVVVINKPTGVAMHDASPPITSDVPVEAGATSPPTSPLPMSSPKNSEYDSKGIVTLLKKQLRLTNLFLCHRLDTGTSGCLCLAKNAHTAARIGDLFAARAVDKYYLALSHTKPKKKQGTIIGDMKNRRKGQRILLKSVENPAITQFFSQSVKPGIRGFIVKPYSGKTHQIRVALKSIGAPLLGDTLYGGKQADRLCLHAWSLRLPTSTGVISVCAPLLEGEHFTDWVVQQWTQGLKQPNEFEWPALPARFTSKHTDSPPHPHFDTLPAND